MTSALQWVRGALGATVITAASLSGAFAQDAAAPQGEPIKVGVLHSLSGTMAISETTLKDAMLMLIDEQNKKGGLLGRPLEAVVVDPASDWPRFAELSRQLLTQDKVAAVFGAWTSVSRKSALPVFEELNGILFYPVQYEGEESSKNVIYTGAAPNQQAIPAVDYLMKEEEVKRWVLAGTDYVYPRTTNTILESYLKGKGVAQGDIFVNYTPFGHSDWSKIVADVVALGIALARELEAEGRSAKDAAIEAARLRLRPILMTSLAFIMGVLPLVLSTGAGAEMRSAMGIAVFAGMIGVTLIGLFLTPVFYVLVRRLAPTRRQAMPAAAPLTGESVPS